MRYFKIDLPIMLRLRVMEDISIDLFDSIEDVIRRPHNFNTTGGYQTSVVAATYDMVGDYNGNEYTIRVYCRMGAETRATKPQYDRALSNEKDSIYVYHMTFWEPDMQVYRILDRFPIIHDFPLYKFIFCKYVNDWENGDIFTFDWLEICGDLGDPPVITLTNGDMSIARDIAWVEPGYIALDPEDGDITANVEVTGTVDTSTVGVYVLTYHVEDSDGNTDTVLREVSIYYINIPPTITLLPNDSNVITPIEIIAGNAWNDPGATADDLEDGDITSNIVVGGDTVLANTVGTYNVVYSITDSSGAIAQATRQVVIIPANTPPVLTVLGDQAPTVTIQDRNVSFRWLTGNREFMGITMPEGHMEEYIDILSLLDGVHRSVISQPANVATPIRSELVDDDGNVIGNAADWMLTEEREFNTNFSIVSKHISAPFTEVSSVPVSVVQRSDTVITHADYLVSGLPMIDATFDSPSMMIYAVAKMIHRTYIGLVIPDGVGYKYSIIDSTGTVVHDNVINPTITPRPNWGALPFFTDPGATATDFEDGNLTPNIVITNNTLQYTQPEVKTFDYDVSDSEGLIDSGTRVVTTRAQTAPYIQIHYGLTANLHQTVVMEKASTPLFNDPGYVGRTANDNDITASVNVSSNLVNTQMAGFYQRQYTLTDTTGLTSDFKRSVIVYELFPPVLTLLGDNPLSIAAGVPAQWNEPGYTAIDPEDGVITPNVIITGDTVDVDTAGVYNVIYTITDSDGLSDTETRVVNVTAAVFPVITLLGDQNEIIPRHSQPQEFFYKIHARVHGANPWTAHTVLAELDVLDGSGNSMVQAPFTSGTTLVDNVPPVFDGDNLTEGWIHQPGNFLDEPGFTFRSTSDMIPPKTITMTAPMAYGGTSMPPTHLLPFFRRQPRGLPIPVVGWSPITLNPSAQVTWTPGSINTITYADNILSAFRSPNHNSYDDPGFTAYDAIDGYITANVTQTVTTWVDLFTPGTYLNTYTVTNSSGNTHTITRTTVVIPYDDPVLTMQGDNPLRMNDGATFVDPGCTAIKGDGGNIVVTYTSGVHELEDGTFAYFYGATDLFGNTGVAIRVIEINEPPWIEIQGANPLELIPDDGDLWVDPGAIATDTEDGDLTASIVVTGDNFDDQVPGTYYVVYTVTDSDGESDSATRVVEVLDIF